MKTKKILISILIALALILMANKVNAASSSQKSIVHTGTTVNMKFEPVGDYWFEYSVSSQGMSIASAKWKISAFVYNNISGSCFNKPLYEKNSSTVTCTVTYSDGKQETFSFTVYITKPTPTPTPTQTDTTSNTSTSQTTPKTNSNTDQSPITTTITTDTTPPTITVTYKKPDGTEIQEGEFTNQDVTVTVTANETIQEINGWTLSGKTLTKTYTENTEETITVSDSAGNTKTETIKVTQIDKSAPQITGVTNEGVYSGKVTPKVEDKNLDKITLKKDEEEQTEWQNGQEITQVGNYEITATDKAGNSTKYSFTIKISPEDIKIKTEEYKEYAEEKIIAYVEQQETVKNFIEKLKVEPEGAKVVVLDAQGKEVGEEETIKTGMKVKIEDQDTYVISVLGDLNGDGESDLRDVATFVSTLLNGPQEDVIEGFEMAADFNKDGEMALIDLTKMIVTLSENMTTTSN